MIQVVGNPLYKRVYISGPITGIKNGNKEQFEMYEDKFKHLNFRVVNPHKLHTQEQEASFTWEQFMKSDIKSMMDCDFIAVLPGWEKSKGANLEVYIARNLSMPIIDATNLQELF